MRKVNLSKILGFAAVLLIAIGCIMPAVFAANPSDAKESVVFIVSDDGKVSGSGFAIGETGKPVEYIVTNNHVVRGDWGYTTARVYFSYATGDYMLANIYYYDTEKDVAVLKLPEATDKRSAMTLCPMKYVNMDDEFAALGYPAGQANEWERYSKDDITITKGGVKNTTRYKGMDMYVLDLEINQGNSGGPLVNSAGEVVGVNSLSITMIYADGSAIENSYSIAIDEIIATIDTNRIPVTIHSDGIPVYVIAAAAAVVVIIIIILIVVLVLTRKKNDNSVQEAAPVSQPASAPMSQPVSAPAPATAPGPAPKTARIIAVGGILNGKKYSVNGTVKMGRDSSKCQIAFPLNTQGVSAVHCELTYDGSVFYIRDLNSSYGTFLSNGKKLAPNAATLLNSGDKFYLASPENTFEIRY